MSYEPLHHKYRPQSFADLVGQEAIASTLSSALRQNKIAPAYLFTGPRGTGKTSSARILAKSLNCLASSGPTDRPCGQCETCQSITKGNSLDIIEIDAASNTGVDNIRELIERAQFAPVQCRYKVYTIDEVHMLSVAAFNALLKTLEEPPPRVVFILATTDPQKVLPTIISRCQRYDFRRIPLEAMVNHLKHIAKKESISIADEALILVAQIAQGGLRDAESLLDQLSLFDGEVTAETVWDLVGAVPEKDLMALLEAIDSLEPEAVIDQARRIMNRGREPLVLLQNLASFYRDLLIAKTAPSRADLVAITPPTWQQLCEFAQRWDSTLMLAGQKHLRESEVQIKNTTQPRLWLEVTLLGLLPSVLTAQAPATSVKQSYPEGNRPISYPTSTPKPSPQPTAPATHPQEQKTPPTPISQSPNPGIPNPPPAPPPERDEMPADPAPGEVHPTAPAVENGADDRDNLDRFWQTVIENIELDGTRNMVKTHCRLLAFSGERASIGIKLKSMYKLIQGISPQIEKAFSTTVGYKVRVNVVVGETAEYQADSAPQMRSPHNSTERAPEAEPPPPAPAVPPANGAPPTKRAPSLPPEDEADEVERSIEQMVNYFNGSVLTLTNELPTEEPPTRDVPPDSSSAVDGWDLPF